MVKAYIKYIKGERIPADRIVLIAHDYLIRFYEHAGFENQGVSECRFAGDLWTDLVRRCNLLPWISANFYTGLRNLDVQILSEGQKRVSMLIS